MKNLKDTFKFNLQLFNGLNNLIDDSLNNDEVEVPEEYLQEVQDGKESSENLQNGLQVEREELENDGDEGSEDSERDGYENSEEQEEIEEEHTVPLAAMLSERSKYKKQLEELNRYKKLVDNLGTTTNLTVEQMEQNVMNAQIQNYKKQGMSDAEAYSHIDNLRQRELESQQNSNSKIRQDITDLSQSDNMFRDAGKYADLIADKMEQVPGLTARDAYMLVLGNKKLDTLSKEGVYAKKATPRKESNTINRDVKGGNMKMVSKKKPKLNELESELARESGMSEEQYINARDNMDFVDYVKASGRQDDYNDKFRHSKRKRKRG